MESDNTYILSTSPWMVYLLKVDMPLSSPDFEDHVRADIGVDLIRGSADIYTGGGRLVKITDERKFQLAKLKHGF